MINKFNLCILSTVSMWCLLLIKTWDVPVCLRFWRGFKWVSLDIIFSPSNIVAYISIVFLLIAFLTYLSIKHEIKGSPISLPIKINKYVDKRQDYINSLATLVTLFAALLIEYQTYRDLLIFILMIVIIFICYTQTNLYYSNPIMALLKYKIAEVETDKGCKELPSGSIVLYKGVMKEKVSPYYISDNVYIL